MIERIAFAAREDKKIDKRSGVSQRLPISCMENVISNAERRAIHQRRRLVVPRIGDVYAAMPAITGKLELEYEGEMKGADHVGRELIRSASRQDLRRVFHRRQHAADRAVVRSGRRDPAGGHGRRGRSSAIASRHSGTDGKARSSRRGPERQPGACRSRRRNLFSKACTRTSASAATKSGCSPPAKNSRSATEKPFEREEPPFRGRRPYN